MTKITMFSAAKKALLASAALGILGYGVVVASDVENFVTPKQAARAERYAVAAMAKHKYDDAIGWGSQAVLGDPHNADYRMVLAQANLSSGRFASAEALFNDVLTLDPTHERAGLNLALTQIALDHGSDARATLDAHRAQIAPADLGLAYALAGDTMNGVRILEAASREESATAKTRQNLALTYALAGRWDESRVAASQDLSPDLVEKRMSDWAQMAHPKASWEQVATLLHVNPVNDPGLSYQLALRDVSNAPVREASAAAPVMPQPVAAPTPTPAPAEPAPRYETAALAAPSVAQPEPQVAPIPTPAPQQVAGVAMPVHQTDLITADRSPAKRFIAERARVRVPAVAHHASHAMLRMATHHVEQKGRFAVQLGAFPSAAAAKSAWLHDVKRVAVLHNYDPAGSAFKLRHASFYRLAVTGFATHQEASVLCGKLRATGNNCFVRSVAGDQLAAWARPAGTVRLAAHVQPHSPKTAPAPAKAAKLQPARPQQQLAQASQKPVAKPAVKALPNAAAKPIAKQTAAMQHTAGQQLAAKR